MRGLVIGAFLIIAYIFKMNTILWIVSRLAGALITAIVVIFQPELRKVVEQLGQKKIMASILPFDAGKEVKERFTDKTVNELIKACYDMAEVKTGALIVIEQEIRLDEYIRTGINVDAILTSQLLINIFEHNTPLHDGAVIVREKTALWQLPVICRFLIIWNSANSLEQDTVPVWVSVR